MRKKPNPNPSLEGREIKTARFGGLFLLRFIYVFFLKNRFRLFSKSVARFLCEAVFG